MSTPKERVEQEYRELAEKRLALNKLLGDIQPTFISDIQWSLLHAQLEAMHTYSKLLVIRLEYWDN